MDQINQLKTNLRQTRDKLNSVVGQVNQQLQNSEQIVDNLSNQMVNQQRNFNQFGTTQYGGGFGTSQYQPQHTGSTNFGSQPYNPKYTGSTYLSSTGPGNLTAGRQYSNQPSSMQGGLNQYGAKYNSGNIDTDVGQSYYQSIQSQVGSMGQNFNQTGTRSQYNPSEIPGATQFAGSTNFTNQTGQSNFNQPSSQRNSGVNQYGALYNSGIQDDDVSQSYYQSRQGF